MRDARSSLVAWRCVVALLSLIALAQFAIEAFHAPATLGLGLGWDAAFAGRPVAPDGFTGFVVDSVPPGSALHARGVVPGDVLHWDKPMERWNAVAAGDRPTVVVTRGASSRRIDIETPLGRPASARQVADYVMDNLLRLVALLVGSAVGWRKAGRVSLRGFAAAGLFAGTAYPHSAPGASHLVALDVLSSIAHDLWPAALLVFAINYPDDRPVGVRALLKRCFPWLAGVHVAVVLACDWSLYAGHFAPTLNWVLKTLLVLLSVCFFVGIVSGWRRSEGEARRRFQWIVVTLGSLVATTLVEPLTALCGQHLAAESIRPLVPALQLLAILALVYAILRHRLFDFGLVINRTLVFGLVGAILLGAMQIANGIVSAFLHFDDNNKAILLSAILAVLVSLSFNQLKAAVERAVDRLFFSKWAASEAALRRFVKEAGFVSEAAPLRRMLVEEVDRFTRGARCALYELTGSAYSCTAGSLRDVPRLIDTNDRAIVAMRAEGKGVAVPAQSSFAASGLLLPMLYRGRLHGFVLVEQRAGDPLYSAEEVSLLDGAIRSLAEDFHALKVEALVQELATERRESSVLRARLDTALLSHERVLLSEVNARRRDAASPSAHGAAEQPPSGGGEGVDGAIAAHGCDPIRTSFPRDRLPPGRHSGGMP